MGFTVQNVYGLLIRSRLLAVDDAKAMYDRWNSESKGGVENVELFTRWMVAHRYVTEYQAMLLARGHADGFYLNQYKILDRLGRGRMAGVYKAVHALGQVVAIKVLPPSKAKDRQMLARFQRESRLSMRLKHPNVVRSFQVAWANGLHYIVMEYLEGETLDEALQRRKKLPPAEAVRLVYQALLGLQHIHEQRLIHRDLKPSNLMLVPARVPGQPDTTLAATVKILDIGLGRTFFEDVNPASSSLEDPNLTGEGVLLGTPDYLAPEQARNARAVDIRADIYSLGCVLYHTLSGQPPFPDTNIIQQMIRHATETPRPLKEFNPEVPDGLQQILNWMMAKDPAQRYPTPERAAQALQVFLAAGTAPAVSAEVEPQMASFLSWLEANNGAAFANPAAGAPVANASGPATMRIRGPSHAKRAGRKHRSKKHKRKPPVGLPAAPPGSGGAPGVDPALGIDVELVPVSLPRKKKSRRKELPAFAGLTRRDFMLLGIGAGAIIGAGIIGWIIAVIRNRFKRVDAAPEEEEKKEEDSKEPEKKALVPKEADKKDPDKTGKKEDDKSEPGKMEKKDTEKMDKKDADKMNKKDADKMDRKMDKKDDKKDEKE